MANYFKMSYDLNTLIDEYQKNIKKYINNDLEDFLNEKIELNNSGNIDIDLQTLKRKFDFNKMNILNDNISNYYLGNELNNLLSYINNNYYVKSSNLDDFVYGINNILNKIEDNKSMNGNYELRRNLETTVSHYVEDHLVPSSIDERKIYAVSEDIAQGIIQNFTISEKYKTLTEELKNNVKSVCNNYLNDNKNSLEKINKVETAEKYNDNNLFELFGIKHINIDGVETYYDLINEEFGEKINGSTDKIRFQNRIISMRSYADNSIAVFDSGLCAKQTPNEEIVVYTGPDLNPIEEKRILAKMDIRNKSFKDVLGNDITLERFSNLLYIWGYQSDWISGTLTKNFSTNNEYVRIRENDSEIKEEQKQVEFENVTEHTSSNIDDNTDELTEEDLKEDKKLLEFENSTPQYSNDTTESQNIDPSIEKALSLYGIKIVIIDGQIEYRNNEGTTLEFKELEDENCFAINLGDDNYIRFNKDNYGVVQANDATGKAVQCSDSNDDVYITSDVNDDTKFFVYNESLDKYYIPGNSDSVDKQIFLNELNKAGFDTTVLREKWGIEIENSIQR